MSKEEGEKGPSVVVVVLRPSVCPVVRPLSVRPRPSVVVVRLMPVRPVVSRRVPTSSSSSSSLLLLCTSRDTDTDSDTDTDRARHTHIHTYTQNTHTDTNESGEKGEKVRGEVEKKEEE